MTPSLAQPAPAYAASETLSLAADLMARDAFTLYCQHISHDVVPPLDPAIHALASERLLSVIARLIPQGWAPQAAQAIEDNAHQLVTFCATSLDLEHWPFAKLQSLFSPVSLSQPDVPDAFGGGEGRIPSNPLLKVGFSAIYAGGKRARKLIGWQADELGAPYYENHGNKGGSIQCYPRPTWGLKEAPPTSDSLWDFIEGLSARTADVALAVLAQLCEPTQGDKPKHPLLQPVLITANAILRYKGIRRWGGERHGVYEWIAEEMKRLQGLHFDVVHYKEYDRATMRLETRDFKGDRLFDIIDVVTYQENLLGDAQIIETAWRVRAGQWAFWWLNTEGRVWMGKMARILLELDHREQRGPALLAKKIGQRMMVLHSALTTVKREPGAPVERIVSHLLEEIGELPVVEERDRNWAGRIRDRFDEAIAVLQKIGVFSQVEWPDGFGPDISDRGKGWANRWLQSKVRIFLSSTSLEPARSQTKPVPVLQKHSTRSRAHPCIDAATLRTLRTQIGWSQDALSDHLGIDQSWISRIERGHQPSPVIRAKLLSWIQSLEAQTMD